MKKIILYLFPLLLIFSAGCSSSKNVVYDDVYYSVKKDNYKKSIEEIYYSDVDSNNISRNTDIVNVTYIENNYDESDYYDYAYTARIRRFHYNYNNNYYSPYYTNLYWYSYNPWDWSISIYIGYSWYHPIYYYDWNYPFYGYYNYYGYYPYSYYHLYYYPHDYYGLNYYNNKNLNTHYYGHRTTENYRNINNIDRTSNIIKKREEIYNNQITRDNVKENNQDVKKQKEYYSKKRVPQPYTSPRNNQPRPKNEYTTPAYKNSREINNKQNYNQPNKQNYNQPNKQNYNQPNKQNYNQPNKQNYNQPNKQNYNQPNKQNYNQPNKQNYNQPSRSSNQSKPTSPNRSSFLNKSGGKR